MKSYGPLANAYHAFKSLVFTPADKQALNAMNLWLDQEAGLLLPNCSDLALLKKAVCHAFTAPDTLEYDFNRMCIGPYKLTVPPYESVYRTGNRTIHTNISAQVAQCYQHLGLIPDTGFNEPADFIGNELEYLYCLKALEHEHTEQGNEAVARELAILHDTFLQEHLGLWYQDFCKDMQQHAKEEFWQLYASVLQQLLSQYIEQISIAKAS